MLLRHRLPLHLPLGEAETAVIPIWAGFGPYKYAYKTEANIMGNNYWIEHFRVRLKHGVPLQSKYIVTLGLVLIHPRRYV